MSHLFRYLLLLPVILTLTSEPALGAKPEKPKPDATVVILSTNIGDIALELDAEKAPLSVNNFLSYVDDGFYNGTIFHRVIKGFMIQGGGFGPGMALKPTKPAIKNEADNGLSNVTGTIAMARTHLPDSATSQFFINTMDNPALNHSGKTPQGWGYAVFGKVVKGMDVVKKIESAVTGRVGRFADVPKQDIVVIKMERQHKTPVKE